MPRLVAKRPFPYDQHDLAAGDEFDATEQDAHVLRTIGMAEDVKPEAAEPPKAKRKYQRRDMQAEE